MYLSMYLSMYLCVPNFKSDYFQFENGFCRAQRLLITIIPIPIYQYQYTDRYNDTDIPIPILIYRYRYWFTDIDIPIPIYRYRYTDTDIPIPIYRYQYIPWLTLIPSTRSLPSFPSDERVVCHSKLNYTIIGQKLAPICSTRFTVQAEFGLATNIVAVAMYINIDLTGWRYFTLYTPILTQLTPLH